MNKRFLLATTAFCAITIFSVNRATAEVNVESVEDVDILSILKNSDTKSPNITWSSSSGGNTVSILAKNYNYTWSRSDTSRGKYESRQSGLSGSVKADFLGSSYSTNSAEGGALYNGSWNTISSLNGDFIANRIINADRAYGGAIFNRDHGKISSIVGNFIANSTSASEDSFGSSIYNFQWAEIGDIKGDFIANRATSSNGYAQAAAIFNRDNSKIGSVTGKFIDNISDAQTHVLGAAISNNQYSSIASIQGNFTSNQAISDKYAEGGAIFNNDNGTIKLIAATFDNNKAEGQTHARGGAIYNSQYSTIIEISADFTENSVSSQNSAEGGAVWNRGTMTFKANGSDSKYEDEVLFQGNYVLIGEGENADRKSEAIYNAGSGSVLNFEAIGNGSYTFYDYINGDGNGVINFTGDNTGVLNLYNDIKGQGAVKFVNSYTINTTDGNIKEIEISSLNMEAASKLNLEADLSGNGKIDSFNLTGTTNTGAANLSLSTLTLLSDMADGTDSLTLAYANADFTAANDITRYISTSNWIYAYTNDATSLQIAKYASSGGYMAFLMKAGMFSTVADVRQYSFTADETIGYNGVVMGDSSNLTINGNNHTLSASSQSGTSALKLTSGQKASISDLKISGFETALETAGQLKLNNVTVKDSKTGLKLGSNVELSGTNTFEGNTTDIEGTGAYTLTLNEDAVLNLSSKLAGKIGFGGSENSIVSFADTVTTEGTDLVLDGPTLKLADEARNLANVNSFEARSGALDLQNDVVRTLVANNFSITGPVNLFVDANLSNQTMDTLGDVTIAGTGSINVAGIKILADSSSAETKITFAESSNKDKVSTSLTEVLSARYTYNVSYNAETGQFEFVREQAIAPENVAPNQTPAAAAANTIMLTEAVSQKVLNADLLKSHGSSSGDEFGLKAWIETFGSNDDIKIKHLSSRLDAKFHSVLAGIDSKVFTYDNGIKATYGLYGAYARSEQKYIDNKIKQKGGYFGVKADLSKGNFFNKMTANVGFLNNESLTAWGKDKFDTTVINLADRTGYNFQVPVRKVSTMDQNDETSYETDLKLTVTPSLYVGYIGVDTDDYVNKAGLKIQNNFMNIIEIAPELTVSKDFGEGLDGYAKVAYRMFFYDNDKVKVNDVLLPTMSVKPYVDYGVGLTKDWSQEEWNPKDVTSYAEIARHDGGREGWNVNLGLKIDF